jgi:hypothetical protein
MLVAIHTGLGYGHRKPALALVPPSQFKSYHIDNVFIIGELDWSPLLKSQLTCVLNIWGLRVPLSKHACRTTRHCWLA